MTTYHRLVMDMTFVCDPDTNEVFDEFTTRVTEELYDLQDAGNSGIIDPDITASLTARWMSVQMLVEADTRRDAERLFAANVRTALHAAGCHTAGWSVLPSEPELPTPKELDYAMS